MMSCEGSFIKVFGVSGGGSGGVFICSSIKGPKNHDECMLVIKCQRGGVKPVGDISKEKKVVVVSDSKKSNIIKLFDKLSIKFLLKLARLVLLVVLFFKVSPFRVLLLAIDPGGPAGVGLGWGPWSVLCRMKRWLVSWFRGAGEPGEVVGEVEGDVANAPAGEGWWAKIKNFFSGWWNWNGGEDAEVADVVNPVEDEGEDDSALVNRFDRLKLVSRDEDTGEKKVDRGEKSLLDNANGLRDDSVAGPRGLSKQPHLREVFLEGNRIDLWRWSERDSIIELDSSTDSDSSVPDSRIALGFSTSPLGGADAVVGPAIGPVDSDSGSAVAIGSGGSDLDTAPTIGPVDSDLDTAPTIGPVDSDLDTAPTIGAADSDLDTAPAIDLVDPDSDSAAPIGPGDSDLGTASAIAPAESQVPTVSASVPVVPGVDSVITDDVGLPVGVKGLPGGSSTADFVPDRDLDLRKYSIKAVPNDVELSKAMAPAESGVQDVGGLKEGAVVPDVGNLGAVGPDVENLGAVGPDVGAPGAVAVDEEAPGAVAPDVEVPGAEARALDEAKTVGELVDLIESKKKVKVQWVKLEPLRSKSGLVIDIVQQKERAGSLMDELDNLRKRNSERAIGGMTSEKIIDIAKNFGGAKK